MKSLFLIWTSLIITLTAGQQQPIDYNNFLRRQTAACCHQTNLTHCPLGHLTNKGPETLYAINKDFVYEIDFSPNDRSLYQKGSSYSRHMVSTFAPQPVDAQVIFQFREAHYAKFGGKFYKYTYNRNQNSWSGMGGSDCGAIHPIFCKEKELGLLLRFAGQFARRTSGSRKDVSSLIAIFGSKTETTNFKAIVYLHANNQMEPPKPIKLGAGLTGLTGFYSAMSALNDQEAVFATFDTGFTCLTMRDKTLPTIDLPQIGNKLMPECFPTNVMYGCPQSFCHSPSMDDLTMEPNDKELVIYRGYYHWKMAWKTLPLDVPDIAKARTYKTPGTAAISSGQIGGDHVQMQFTDDGSMVRFITVKKGGGGGSESATNKVSIQVIFPHSATTRYFSAAWFNQLTNQLLLFDETQVYIYQAPAQLMQDIYTPNVWSQNSTVDIKSVLTGISGPIEAIFSKDGTLYVFQGQVFFRQKITDFAARKPFTPEWVAGDRSKKTGFFATKEDCSYSDQDLKYIKTRLYPLVLNKPADGRPVTTTIKPTTGKTTTSKLPTINPGGSGSPAKPGSPTLTTALPGGGSGTATNADKETVSPKSPKRSLVYIVVGLILFVVLLIGVGAYFVLSPKSAGKSSRRPAAFNKNRR